jgi:hypothetical protein
VAKEVSFDRSKTPVGLLYTSSHFGAGTLDWEDRLIAKVVSMKRVLR